jgi:hypothetical protein
MRRGSACDFGPPVFLQLVKNSRSRKLKLEHREERVSNRYKRSCICIPFVLVSVLSLLAQSDRMEVKRGDDLQLKLSDRSRPLLTAALVEAPAVGNVSNDSELPDAPSSTKPDASTADPAASPVVKRQSHGAPPAALGGPLGVDRTVADRNYLVLTGGMFGASIANAELTIRCLQQHPSCNDVPRSLQSRAAIYGIGIPADLGVAYLTYCLKRKHNHIWYVPAAAVTGANLFFAYRAYHWGQERSIP